MGTGRPRTLASALVALALIAVAAPAPASAKPKGEHHVFTFGSRSLARGVKGKDVRYLQRALTRLGIATSVDGIFGKGTRKSVKALERQRGWPVNGVISRKDAKRIQKLLAKHRVSGGYFVAGYSGPHPDGPRQALRPGQGQGASMPPATVVQAIDVTLLGGGSQDVAWNGMLNGERRSRRDLPAQARRPGLDRSQRDRPDAAVRDAPARLSRCSVRTTSAARTPASARRARDTSTRDRTSSPAAARRRSWTRPGRSGSTPTRPAAPATTSCCMGPSPGPTPSTCT